MKKFIIIGSRRRNTEQDFLKVYREFSKYYEDGDIIISGGCPKGGDRFAEIIVAGRLGLTEAAKTLLIHRPIKPKNGSPNWAFTKAFYDRNTIVAKEADDNTITIACVSSDRKGGTEDTLKKIKKGKVILV